MLKREIKRWDLVLLLINGTIGAGIFGLPSKIFALSGVYSLWALLICAIFIFVLILCFAEVASRFQATGGPYLYILKAFGKIPAFILGWLLLITRLSTYAALVNLFITYLAIFLPEIVQPIPRFMGILLVTALLTWVNYIGVKNSTRLNNFLAIAKMLPLLVFVGIGVFHLNSDLLVPGIMPSLSDFSSSILVLIFAFTGFEAILVNTGEIRDPQRIIPFALISSMVIITAFYAGIQLVSIGTLPELAQSSTPLTDASGNFLGPWGVWLISIGALLSIGGTLNSVMLVGSRVPFALSVEGQFPAFFEKIHPRYHTPITSLLGFSLFTFIASVTGTFIYAVAISVISKVLIFLMVCAALIRLRKKSNKEENKVFKVPGGQYLALVGIAGSLLLLASSGLEEVWLVLLTTCIGLLFYLVFRRKN